ncbi:MAG: hypothetical protein K5696_09350 [Lachnospiraceae bacterium]|nr:hypothetical protein [Lachnospiraceae bacterium]
MKRRISVKTYRLIDLGIFAFLLVLFESLLVRAARVWFADQLYTVSVVAAVTGIVMMRWGAFGLIHAVLGGAVFALMAGGSAQHFACYCIGNLAASGALLFLKAAGKNRVSREGWLTLLYAVIVQVLMQAGRTLIALIFGVSPSVAAGFFTTDSLSVVFTMLILWIAGRQDGLLEDQRSFLERTREEDARRLEEEDGFGS